MGAEKHCSKSGGGYVGGLLQLFDWNAKSRKKLFSSKSTVPEQSKQKKRYDGNLPGTRLALMDEDETLTGSSIKDSSDYSCASSVTDDEFGGARAPGVVARLMGLDSMPTSNISDPYSTPFFDSQSHQDAYWCSRNLAGKSHYQVNHSGSLQGKMEAPVRNVLEPKNLKISSRPIEKFQTEMLPPKSAKSIPITHHKLLSPIKSANFIPSENAAHIMEAAARIIGPGPQATTSKAKVPSVGSSSIPLKVRDLKEKVDAAQKPLKLSEASRKPGESNALKYLKGQSMNKSWNGSADSMSARAADSVAARASSDADECSSSTKGKGKSISLALQAKANVQKREGINPSGSRNLVGQQESNGVISIELFRSQPSTQKSTHKKPSALGAPNVLRQNNQKQNCSADKAKLPSKLSASKSQVRKPVGGDSSFVRYKSSSKSAGNSKAATRRSSNSDVIIDGKREEDSNSNTRNITCKKRSIDGNFHLEKNTCEKLIQSSSVPKEKETNKRIGTDVISFTFTAPMTRSLTGPETCKGVTEKSAALSANYRSKGSLFIPDDNASKFSFLGNNTIGGDALSTLLEQKLRELTHGVETSRNKAGNDDSSLPIFQELRPGVNDALSTTTSLEKYQTHYQMHRDEVVSQFSSGFSSTDLHGYIMKHKFQGMAHEMNRNPRNDIEAKNFLDCRLPSPLSVLEHSPFAESFNSSDAADSISEGGSKQSSSVQAQEVFGISFPQKFSTLEADAELSDSASSLSMRTIASKQLSTFTSKDPVKSTEWELEYVNEILCNIELMFKDFAMGRAREIINPHLFDQLESRRTVFDGHGHESIRLRRKVLFDCVTECLDIRCRRYASGGYETWVKGLSLVKSKERLAEEVYREITGWIGTSDSMVDELVDSDMSNKYGRWLDFEIEAFELGVKIESRILNHLLDEVIADLL